MKQNFGGENWRGFIPIPICEDNPKYLEFYEKAWELAYAHIKSIDGMPQTPYMDEAFCETQVWIWDSCFMSLFCKYAKEAFPGVETLNNPFIDFKISNFDFGTDESINYIDFLHRNNVDAVIVQDLGLMDYLRKVYPNKILTHFIIKHCTKCQ